ncbi:MAG: oxidoreductase, partial [Candidatus Atribacteria bacterium]|nr:oxidoreductase [Candidatus Atribacteria bacterium]
MTLTPKTYSKPKVAVYKFSSCDGCQLSILNLEDELLDLASAVEFAYFLEATRTVKPGPYDVGIVEGSVTTPHEAARIKEVRTECKFLVSLGTCATAGGIQALRNFARADEYARTVYA